MGTSVKSWAALAVVSGWLLSVGLRPVAAKGEGPEAIAISPDGARLYVACSVIQHNNLTSILQVIDTANLKVVGAPKAFDYVASMAVSPDGSRLYLSRGDAIVVLDPTANQVVATVSPDRDLGLGSLAVSPDGRLLYAAEVDYTSPKRREPLLPNGGLLVLDTATYKVLARVDLGRETHGVAVSPDGRYVYLANCDCGDPNAKLTGAIAVIDASTHHVVATVPLGSYLGSMTAGPDGTGLYVTVNFSSVVLIVTAAGREAGALSVGGEGPVNIALSPDGSRLYAALNASAAVSATDTVSHAPVGMAKVDNFPSLLVASPDGKHVYVAHEGSDILSVIDTATMSREASIKTTP